MRNPCAAFVSFVLLVVVGSASSAAQDAKKTVEPEYLGTFFSLNSDDGALSPLERQTPAIRTKVKGLGFGGGDAFGEVSGAKSPIRFTAGSVPAFIVRAASRDKDPASTIQFFAWKVNKDSRVMIISKVRALGLGTQSGTGASDVRFIASKFGDASFKVVPESPLPPGEYALSMVDIRDAFFFGVDPVIPK